MSVRFIFRGLLVMVILVLITWLLKDVLDQDWIDAQVRANGVAGVLLFVLVCCLLGSIGLSRQVIAFLGGYAFGFSQGFLLSMLAVVGACITTFYIARLLLRAFLEKQFSVRIQQVDLFLRENTFTMALLVRLLPLGSNWMINIAAGVFQCKKTAFFSGFGAGLYTANAYFFTSRQRCTGGSVLASGDCNGPVRTGSCPWHRPLSKYCTRQDTGSAA